MSTLSAPSSSTPKRIAPAALIAAVLSAAGMTALFGSEAVFAALALDWAGTGLLHLPEPALLTFGAVPLAAALYATVWMARRAWQFERAEACMIGEGGA